MSTLLITDLQKYLSPIVISEIDGGGDIYFEKKEINLLLSHLKSEFNFLVLLDLCAEDLLGKKFVNESHTHRYEVVYHLLNLEYLMLRKYYLSKSLHRMALPYTLSESVFLTSQVLFH